MCSSFLLFNIIYKQKQDLLTVGGFFFPILPIHELSLNHEHFSDAELAMQDPCKKLIWIQMNICRFYLLLAQSWSTSSVSWLMRLLKSTPPLKAMWQFNHQMITFGFTGHGLSSFDSFHTFPKCLWDCIFLLDIGK